MSPEQAQASDVELLHAIARGDEQALAALYDRYKAILFGFTSRILHSRMEAEDVLQDIFLQVWQKAHSFDEQRGRAFTWLVTLARSRAIDRLRALNSRERVTMEAARAMHETVADAAAEAVTAEEGAVVRKALAELTEEQRRALQLAYYEGLTQTEIAARLKLPLGTVKTRMRSGLLKLREILITMSAPNLPEPQLPPLCWKRLRRPA